MKKTITTRIYNALAIFILLLLPGAGFCQVSAIGGVNSTRSGSYLRPDLPASETPKLHFILNMEKMISKGNFNPSTDTLWLILTVPKDTMFSLQPGAAPDNYKYYGNIDSGIDSGYVYRYIYRINDTIFENFSRKVKAEPGVITAESWWNDDSIHPATFKVDMSYAKAIGAFNPATDFVNLAGTMNGWAGSDHMTMGANDVYSIQYDLMPGKTYEFKFRINGDTNTSEFPHGGPARMTRGPVQAETLSYVFNDYDPAAVPVTFNCDMWYQLHAGHFSDSLDFLDIAGNFNGNGAYDLLFDRAHDSIYTLTKLIDTSYINNSTPLNFLFRFNGNWNTAESLPGGSQRTYQPHDTTGGNKNIFTCWYDDKNPTIPTAPWVYNVAIQGSLAVGLVMSGIYTYEDVNGDPEGVSMYQWYYADDAAGTNLTPVENADSITFVPTAAGYQKYVFFEVTPIAQSGIYTEGNPVKVATQGPLGGLGINSLSGISLLLYPNPVSGNLAVESTVMLNRMEVYNLAGQRVMTKETGSSQKVYLDVSELNSGIYFLKCYDNDNRSCVTRFIKN